MSEHLLVVLLALLVAASAGLLLSAAVLGWWQDRLRCQRTADQRQHLAAIRHTRRLAELQIDQLTMNALEHMMAETQKADRQ